MGSKLYVGNIPFNATEEDLRRIFSEGGRRVVEVQIMADRFTGRSRGFAFVTMSSDQEAFDAMTQLASQEGILCGISSGAAIFVALKVARELGRGRVVVILPDTGERYLSVQQYFEV